MLAAARACDPRQLFEWGALIDEREDSRFLQLPAQGTSFCIEVQRALRTIQAKLGDRKALALIEDELDDRQTELHAIRDLAIVGDDDAIAALMRFAQKHDSDPTIAIQSGDFVYNPLAEISQAMRSIAARRALKNFPRNGWIPGHGDWRVWLQWWNQNRADSSSPASVAVFKDVLDADMRCLTRRVEWGYPKAILALGALDNPVALSILQRFPRYPDRQAFGTEEGNIEAALARQGDKQEFELIRYELTSAAPTMPVEKLCYIGGRSAVDALIQQLVSQARLAVSESPGHLQPKGKKRKSKPKVNDQILIESKQAYLKSIMEALANMIKSPPLSSTVAPTTENIQKWINWWSENKDSAEFIASHVTTY